MQSTNEEFWLFLESNVNFFNFFLRPMDMVQVWEKKKIHYVLKHSSDVWTLKYYAINSC